MSFFLLVRLRPLIHSSIAGKRHHLQLSIGHYSILSGWRWETQVYPPIKNVILPSDRTVVGGRAGVVAAQASRSPGRPASTTKDLRVEVAAPGTLTFSTTR